MVWRKTKVENHTNTTNTSVRRSIKVKCFNVTYVPPQSPNDCRNAPLANGELPSTYTPTITYASIHTNTHTHSSKYINGRVRYANMEKHIVFRACRSGGNTHTHTKYHWVGSIVTARRAHLSLGRRHKKKLYRTYSSCLGGNAKKNCLPKREVSNRCESVISTEGWLMVAHVCLEL